MNLHEFRDRLHLHPIEFDKHINQEKHVGETIDFSTNCARTAVCLHIKENLDPYLTPNSKAN